MSKIIFFKYHTLCKNSNPGPIFAVAIVVVTPPAPPPPLSVAIFLYTLLTPRVLTSFYLEARLRLLLADLIFKIVDPSA